MDGIICIYKEKGMTSFDVVAAVRRIYKTKKVGHGGTLDPMAEGVLPVFVGSATKAADFCPDDTKQYLAGFQFGITTDTQDITGKVLSTCDEYVSRNKMPMVERLFSGEQLQTPPMYSAVKVNGQRLYDLARKGEIVSRQPRKITVYEIKVTKYGYNSGEMSVTCSKGTYIRTLIHDIGQKLGTGAVMTSLVRTRSGVFRLEESHKLSELEGKTEKELSELLMPLEKLYGQLPKARLDEQQTRLFRNGAELDADRIRFDTIYDKGYYIEGSDGVLLGLGKIGSKHQLEVMRRFNTETAAAIEKAAKEQSYTPPPPVSEAEAAKEKEFVPKRKPPAANGENKDKEISAEREAPKTAETAVSEQKSEEITEIEDIKRESEETAEAAAFEDKSEELTETTAFEEQSEETTETAVSEQESEEAAETAVSVEESEETTETTVSKQESEQATEMAVSEEKSEEITETVISEQESEQATETVISEQESEEATETVVSEEESEETTETVVSEQESEEATETVVSEQESEEATETAASEKKTEEITEIADTEQESEEAAEIAASEEESDEVTEITVSEQIPEKADESTGVPDSDENSIEKTDVFMQMNALPEEQESDMVLSEADAADNTSENTEELLELSAFAPVESDNSGSADISESADNSDGAIGSEGADETGNIESAVSVFDSTASDASEETESVIDEDYLAYLEKALDLNDEEIAANTPTGKE